MVKTRKRKTRKSRKVRKVRKSRRGGGNCISSLCQPAISSMIKKKPKDQQLLFAVGYNCETLVEELLADDDIKSNINAVDTKGNTLLIHAISNANTSIAEALLDAGINPNTVRAEGLNAGMPPLILALSFMGNPEKTRNRDEIAKLLFANPGTNLDARYGDQRSSVLTTCIYFGKAELAKIFIPRLPPSVLNVGETSKTPLMLTILFPETPGITLESRDEIAIALINDTRTTINARDRYHTALEYAILNGRLRIVQALIESDRIDINIIRGIYYNVLASDKSIKPDIIELIVNKQDEHGNTLLHYATEDQNLKILKLLLANEANPNIQNLSGDTALHVASRFLWLEGMDALKPDTDDTIKNNEKPKGKTASDIETAQKTEFKKPVTSQIKQLGPEISSAFAARGMLDNPEPWSTSAEELRSGKPSDYEGPPEGSIKRIVECIDFAAMYGAVTDS